MKTTLLLILFTITFSVNAQIAAQAKIFNGIVVAGYVDNGAYLNFAGPNIS